MNANFQHPSARKVDATDDTASPLAAGCRADRACCCPAKPVVEVIMPPAPGRPRGTGLLLCGHHYRASRRALAAASAIVYELPGMPEDTAEWLGVGQHSPAPAAA
jgi:hypothetical protein